MNDDIAIARSREYTWASLLDRHVHERPDDIALRFEGESTTWRQLREQVDRLADHLAAAGVGSGDRVALVLMNRPEYVVAVTAICELRAICVPVNFRLAVDELAYIFEHSDPAYVITEAALAGPVTAAVAQGRRRPVHDLDAIGLGDARPQTPRELTVFADHEPAFIFYTSGTTGRPKGATLSWRNLRAQSDILIRAWRLTGSHEVVAAATPTFHIAGLGLMMAPFAIGGTIVIFGLTGFDPAALVDAVEAERIGSLFLVPAQWQAMVQLPDLIGRMPTLRTTAWGAAPASATLLQRMAEAFPQAQNIALFGQTEMSPIACMLFGEDSLRKLGSVGQAADGVQIRVVDAEGRDVPAGRIGEIVYRGAGTMLGYWNNSEATAAAFQGGWFHSGDLVSVDEDGFVFVVDRVKDMIITGGENVYSVEVENALASHPNVAEVAVVGRPDEKWGEVVVAFVTAASSPAPTLDELREHLATRLAPYKHPRDLRILDALPRNATGKLVKTALRDSL